MWVVLDDVQAGLAFHQPLRLIRAEGPEEVPAALAALEEARSQGHWLAGWLGYELGYALEPRLAPLMAPHSGPLLCFGVFAGPTEKRPDFEARAYAGPLRPDWDAPAYGRAFAQVKEAIAAGDIYQANLSFRARFAFAGDAYGFYRGLRDAGAAPHCAYVDFLDAKDARQIVSLSPELFFDLTADGALTARPMKGTAPLERGAEMLAGSAKDRAENLMIVDLIRNDLGRIAEIGSVAVRDLFQVETYPTLLAMVSTVTARLRPGARIAEILRALFPCGSVTGAPKIRAMEILRALESSPRGAYCGGIGFFAPDGSARFNVAIRTITIAGGQGTLGLGGGVVQDSTAGGEYAECLLKARFFEAARRKLELIETLRFDQGFVRLESHLARMAASAPVFGFHFNDRAARRALDKAVGEGQGVLRVRLTLDEMGDHRATAGPLPQGPPHWTYAISSERISRHDIFYRHKTSWRDLYDSEAARLGTDEVLFLNREGEVTEGTRSNVFIKRNGKLLTTPLACGLLDGRLRAELIAQGRCEEAILTEADLHGELYFGNSLRGLIAGRLVEPGRI